MSQSLSPEIIGTTNEDTPHTRILEAALDMFLQVGISKTSLQDVAAAAGVSRGTVYRYFTDRQALVDATIEYRSRKYYEDAARAMRSADTFEEQIAAFSVVVARTVANFRRHRMIDEETLFLRLISADSNGALRRMSHFLEPYIVEARDRNEIAADVDEIAASEWVARVLMSIPKMSESANFDIDKPKTVADFFRRHAVRGLRP